VLGDGSAQFEVRHINEAAPAVGPSMKQQVAVPSQAKTVSDGEDGGCHGPLASATLNAHFSGTMSFFSYFSPIPISQNGCAMSYLFFLLNGKLKNQNSKFPAGSFHSLRSLVTCNSDVNCFVLQLVVHTIFIKSEFRFVLY
jgi:hypothetical protein